MDPVRWSTLLADWSSGPGPRYTRLAEALRSSISQGHLRPLERLPSERSLAELLQLSRGTVVAAYEELAADGWVRRRQGSGTHVAPSAPRAAEVMDLRSPVRGPGTTPGEIDLTIAVPHLSDAQRERLAAAGTGAFVDSFYHPLGWPELRVWLAEMYTREGLPTAPEQVIVTSGAQQAISLVASTFVRGQDTVLMESPTYFGAIDVLRALGATLRGVPVTRQGVDPEAFRDLARAGARLAFLTPSFHNPTGSVVPWLARERLAEACRAARLPTIEDDTLIDLGFDETPPPRLACVTPDAPVICVGSLSKLFWAGLRVGWLRAPRALLTPLVQAKTLADFGSSLPAQVIALNLLRDLDGLREERRALVRPARDRLVVLLRDHLPDWRFEVPSGGQFLWVELPTRNATGFTQVARRHGVRLFPGAAMSVTSLPDRFLRLPFTLPPEHLVEGVRRLREAWSLFEDRQGTERLV